MRRNEERHGIGAAFTLLTFGLFALCVLAVLLTGAQSYRRLTRRDAESWSRRTGVQYVAAKVRRADAAGRVFVGGFDGAHSGADTLFLEETVGEETYVTRVYWYDGAIRELFTAADAEAAPEDGEIVLAAQGLSFSLSARLLSVTATADTGAVSRLSLFLRSAPEEETGGAA